MVKWIGAVVFAATIGVAVWWFGATPRGEVTLGHTMTECNGPGRARLALDKRFWSITRFDGPIGGDTYEVRVSQVRADGTTRQIKAWSVSRKVDDQDTLYFGRATVAKTTGGRAGPMRFELYDADRLLASKDFEVVAAE